MAKEMDRSIEEDADRDLHDRKPSTIAKLVGRASAVLRADEDMEAVLSAFSELDPDAIEKCTVEEARRNPTVADAVRRILAEQNRDDRPEALVPGVTASDREIPGAASNLRARVYRPDGTGPFPGIVYFHGGGWVIADLDVYDGGARGLAAQAGAVVVSVDYRRAPEAPFPAAWDDALFAYHWVTEHAAELEIDPQRLALAGESAGGSLAVATAVALKSASSPPLRHVLAVYPVAQTGSTSTASYIENALAMPLNRAMMPWFLDKLVLDPLDRTDPRLDLVHADLAGLPPVTIVNALLDPLRSDGAMLEDALRKAGVPVERMDYHGVTHEFFGMAAVVGKARIAQAYAGERLRMSFEEPAVI